MTTQIIRDTDGVITIGKFCIFGGSKSKLQTISCDGAVDEVHYSIASHETMGEYFAIEEALNTATVQVDNQIFSFSDFESGFSQSVETHTMIDWSYDDLPEGFNLINTILTNVYSMIPENQTLKFKFQDKFKGLIMFVTPEQHNKSIVNTGTEMSFCLSGFSPPVPVS